VTGIRNGPPRKLGSNSGRGEGFISPLRDFPIAPKTLLISYSMLTAGLFFSEVQRPGRDTEHSHPPGAEVNYDPPPPPEATVLLLIRFCTVSESFLFKTKPITKFGVTGAVITRNRKKLDTTNISFHASLDVCLPASKLQHT